MITIIILLLINIVGLQAQLTPKIFSYPNDCPSRDKTLRPFLGLYSARALAAGLGSPVLPCEREDEVSSMWLIFKGLKAGKNIFEEFIKQKSPKEILLECLPPLIMHAQEYDKEMFKKIAPFAVDTVNSFFELSYPDRTLNSLGRHFYKTLSQHYLEYKGIRVGSLVNRPDDVFLSDKWATQSVHHRTDRITVCGPNDKGLIAVLSKEFFYCNDQVFFEGIQSYQEDPGNDLKSFRKFGLYKILDRKNSSLGSVEVTLDENLKKDVKYLLALHPSENRLCYINTLDQLCVTDPDCLVGFSIENNRSKELWQETKAWFIGQSKLILCTWKNNYFDERNKRKTLFSLIDYSTPHSIKKNCFTSDIFFADKEKYLYELFPPLEEKKWVYKAWPEEKDKDYEYIDIKINRMWCPVDSCEIFIELIITRDNLLLGDECFEQDGDVVSCLLKSNSNFNQFSLLTVEKGSVGTRYNSYQEYNYLNYYKELPDYYFNNCYPLTYNTKSFSYWANNSSQFDWTKESLFADGQRPREKFKFVHSFFPWNYTRLSVEQKNALRGALFYLLAWSDDGNKDLVDKTAQWIINSEKDRQEGSNILEQLKAKKPGDRNRLLYRTGELFGTLHKMLQERKK